MSMMIFADASAEQAIGWVSQLGSAGLAALAVWWLTGKHEKAIAAMAAAHAAAVAATAAATDKLAAIIEKRSDMYQDMERQRIVIMTTMTTTLGAIERRLSEVEGAISKPLPPPMVKVSGS